MMKVLAVIACAVLVSAAPPRVPMLDGRIVGGEATQIEQYPYQASLQYFLSHICGAVIISENYVVTAAHCTDGYVITNNSRKETLIQLISER